MIILFQFILNLSCFFFSLFEWENMINLKMNQLTIFVENFKLNVFYSNETQLNKLLVRNQFIIYRFNYIPIKLSFVS